MIDTRMPAVAAVDWGTTRMRVWLLDSGGAVLGERRSDEGMLTAAGIGFAKVLERHLSELAAPEKLPAIVCGMAGARQGWIEAPYAETPATLGDVLAGAVPVPGVERDVRIVPGIAQKDIVAPDVMRGEETQLAGISALRGPGSHLVCMPGTHSKWVAVKDGVVTGFGTWMTGELYSVIAKESVLKHSVGGGSLAFSPRSPAYAKAVKQGLDDSASLTSRLFGIRAGSLLHKLASEDAAATLSGLLIGAEIAGARARYGGHDSVVLVGSGLMYDLYAVALETAGLVSRQADADEAVRSGLFEAAKRCGMVTG
ncbi:MAG: 2-dehydro-3-deoxygalactonokinase [Rhizobiaceae bacterium]